jgi:glycosyltransferase involved in cell wall biosynthesis
MRIVIDLQGAQGQSRNRGIGRYTLSLVRALIEANKQHQYLLAINGMLQDSALHLRHEFKSLIEDENIKVWFAHGQVSFISSSNDDCRDIASRLYEGFIDSLKPDLLLVTSLFEGLGDNSITCISTNKKPYPVAAILYDLIPMLNRSPYLDNPTHARWYDEKINHLKRADLLLAISESSRQEGIQYLGFPEHKVVNISSAIEDFFQPVNVTSEQEAAIRERYGLEKPFIMYTGGIDYRKNIEGLIKAFSPISAPTRDQYQLAVVCSVAEQDMDRLQYLAECSGLPRQALVMTGYVPERDLLELYNLCELFVFPSLHEGFGLPALEAMACGAAVIASDRTSLPEVVGKKEALFDPTKPLEISQMIQRYLSDCTLLNELRMHGIQQARRFSWKATAERTLPALENASREHGTTETELAVPPKLAFVSPLPPQRSGISDYSAMLLPALAQYYTIDLISDEIQGNVTFDGITFTAHSTDRLLQHASEYDRVVYQFGNSAFHSHMFELLNQVPGVVVLHDFYLSGIVAHREYAEQLTHSWANALYRGHGYQALAERVHTKDPSDIIWKYPCNLDVLQQALNVIVHTPSSVEMARNWYGNNAAQHWHTVPLVRIPADNNTEFKGDIRERLGIPKTAFVVCSFGFLGRTKLNHRLLDAWLSSDMAQQQDAYLIFVGENEPGEYGVQLQKKIASCEASERIRITGWTDTHEYLNYLNAADVGVQLRTLSRGETSAAVLDCMNHGLATIVNANGSMADLEDSMVIKLPDNFDETELGLALERLASDTQYRQRLGQAASAHIHQHHTPQYCAELYHNAIEQTYQMADGNVGYLADRLAELPALSRLSEQERCSLASCVDTSIAETPRRPVLFLDITELVRHAGVKVQPFTAILLERWLQSPPGHYRLEPVYLTESGEIRSAASFVLNWLGCDREILTDEPVSVRSGDLWLGLELPDSHHHAMQEHYELFTLMGAHIGKAFSAELPADAATKIGDLEQLFVGCLNDPVPRILVDVSEFALRDAGTGIQRVVRNILAQWEQASPPGRKVLPIVADTNVKGYRSFHTGLQLRKLGFPSGLLPEKPLVVCPGDIFLGLDLQPSVVVYQQSVYRRWREQGVWTAFVVYDLLCINYPQYFLPGAQSGFAAWLDVVAEADQLIAISQTVAGQLESRLEHRTQRPTISWFHLGADLDTKAKGSCGVAKRKDTTAAVQFLMVGTLEPRKGHAQVLAAFEQLWHNGENFILVIAGKQGWMVDELAQYILQHPELGRRLQWHQAPDDGQLQTLYQNADCLLAASWDEGFGLPLIEASREGMHVLARDIPVFREVATSHATFFNAQNSTELASAITEWVASFRSGQLPSPGNMHWLTWEQSAQQLTECLPLRKMLAQNNL